MSIAVPTNATNPNPEANDARACSPVEASAVECSGSPAGPPAVNPGIGPRSTGAPVSGSTGALFAQPKFRERFLPKIDKSSSASGCWLWTGAKNDCGYGQIYYRPSEGDRGRIVYAHRASWIMAFGEIPAGRGHHGTCVLHRCDNPSCVNPDHLFLGTHRENMRDKEDKGRSNVPMGERNGSAKLTNSEVIEIRKASGSHGQIARRFRVSRVAVLKIRAGKQWRHLPLPGSQR